MASETFLASFGLIGMRLVELYGIDSQRFKDSLGIDPKLRRDPKARLPSSVADHGFLKAAALIPDPAFGLRAAECWHPSNLGALGYAWLSSSCLRVGLNRLARYGRIIGTKAIVGCVEEGENLRLWFEHGRGDAKHGAIIADFHLALIVAMCRANSGAELHPESVNLRRAKPAKTQPYLDFFGCPVNFGADDDSILFAQASVDRLLPTANDELAITFDAILGAQLQTLDNDDIGSRCKAYLTRQLTSGEPSEESLAYAMGMSRRTLQRRLVEACLSYKTLLDETRYQLAQRYLDDPQKTVTDITFLLGFSEQSAFSRAFKRWSGRAPTEYRAKHLALA